MNVAEFLQDCRVDVRTEGEHHHTTSGFLQVDCPFCSAGTGRFRLGISVNGTHAACWTCGGLNIVDVLVALSEKPKREVFGIFKSFDREPSQRIERKGSLVLPMGIGDLKPAHKAYLRRRGFAIKPLERLWRLQGIGIAAHLQWRIFIPFYYHGQVVSWTTRSISDKGKRYISAAHDQEAIPHKTLLYGEDYARQSIIIVEGPTDVWRIGPGAVATCGIGFSAAQLLRMSKYPVRYVCLDNEPEAQKRARQLCDQLQGFPGTTANITLDAGDPGSASRKEIKQLRSLVA